MEPLAATLFTAIQMGISTLIQFMVVLMAAVPLTHPQMEPLRLVTNRV